MVVFTLFSWFGYSEERTYINVPRRQQDESIGTAVSAAMPFTARLARRVSLKHFSRCAPGSELPEQDERTTYATHQSKRCGERSDWRRGQHNQCGRRAERLTYPDRLHARLPGRSVLCAAKTHQQRQHQRENEQSGKITGVEQCKFTHIKCLSLQSDKSIQYLLREAV